MFFVNEEKINLNSDGVGLNTFESQGFDLTYIELDPIDKKDLELRNY